MAVIEGLQGVALVQSGDRDVLVAQGSVAPGSDERCTASTRFQIASVSKQFTAAAVLTLCDRGALGLDDPIARWVEGCPSSWDAITLHRLLTHTAGLVHWHQLRELSLTTWISPSDELALFFEAPLLSTPGTTYAYSSPGYVLLAHAVERASGRPYAAFLEDELFGPLDMTATFAGSGAREPRCAVGTNKGIAVDSFELDVVGMGAGDVWSTVGDLARWDRALAAGEILHDASRAAMLTAHTPIDNAELAAGLVEIDGYGYGLLCGRLAGGPRMTFHTGDNSGFVSLNAWFPDDDLRLVVLCNDEAVDLLSVAPQLLAIAFSG
jgi:CubicO group peptidase (beta-lactamase class C family)